MYAIVAGGGKVGSNVARSLLAMGHEVTLIEQRPYRFEQLQEEFEHQVLLGDATELRTSPTWFPESSMSWAPCGGASVLAARSPRKCRFTWPRKWTRATTSCPM